MDLKTVELGEIEDVQRLFSYPPNCHEICFLQQSLEETIAHYLQASISRDQLDGLAVSIRTEQEHIFVEIRGKEAAEYGDLIKSFVEVGQLAFKASLQLSAEKQWRYNWRFFLPLGLAMARHRTVQLLHFPPDYVLGRDQDYLSAHTTLRWAELLAANGVKSSETSLYQTIIDIAPVAAPSNDGRNLEGIYNYYSDYIVGLLRLWLPTGVGTMRPMVAFGAPVRDWIKSEYGVELKVLSVANLDISSEIQVPTLAANHPSFIYNAVSRLKDDPNTSENERIAVAMGIMQQDLIAASWQMQMGQDPNADPEKTLLACRRVWSDPAKQRQVCKLTYVQAFNKSPEEADQLCVQLHKPLTMLIEFTKPPEVQAFEDRIQALRMELGALESREPKDLAI